MGIRSLQEDKWWNSLFKGTKLMHADGNIQYANYQSEEQMSDYLTSNGYESTLSEITT